METACDIFIFCRFIGLAYIDVEHLSHDNIQSALPNFKILGWGWYYLSTVIDDYSRYPNRRNAS
jgi:hypothetical protein